MKKFAILCGLVMLGSGSALANTGDIERGQELSQTCAECHGPDGNSPTAGFPAIAGQHSKYLVKQLREYKLGSETGGEQGRFDPVMSSQAANLDEQDMLDLAAYFSSQTNEVVGTDLEESELAEAQRLYLGGDEDRGITACAACHGPRANGLSLAGFPLLSGQHSQYTRAVLERFRSGERDNDPNGMMRDVATHLTDRDIDLLSRYISGLY